MNKLVLTGLLLIALLPIYFHDSFRATPAPVSPLRIGTNVWIGYEPLYLAQYQGAFDDYPIKLIEMPSATDVAQAFRNHLLDVAALTLDEALMLKRYAPDLRVFLVVDFSNGADVLLVNPNALTNLPELKGKRIGTEHTALGALMLDSVLHAAGLTVSDITLVPLTVDIHESSYLSGKVDALITFDPHRSRLLQSGAVELFDSSHIPDRIVDVLVTRQSILDNRLQDLTALAHIYFRTVDALHRKDVESLRVLAQGLETTVDSVQEQLDKIKQPSLEENRRLLNRNSPALIASVRNLHELMLDRHLLDAAVTLDDILTDAVVNTETLAKPQTEPKE
ncbi:MAG: hypothetical protein Kow0065_04280 [Methylomicrobium sp.]